MRMIVIIFLIDYTFYYNFTETLESARDKLASLQRQHFTSIAKSKNKSLKAKFIKKVSNPKIKLSSVPKLNEPAVLKNDMNTGRGDLKRKSAEFNTPNDVASDSQNSGSENESGSDIELDKTVPKSKVFNIFQLFCFCICTIEY